MNPFIELQKTIAVFFIALVCFGLSPASKAVNPPPDGGYLGLNTAEGQNALKNLTTGSANTAVGWFSLFSNTGGSNNTAIGAGTLLFNMPGQFGGGNDNTAIGTAALLFNTTGSGNTAVGTAALENNTDSFNTAIGENALSTNTNGFENTAIGAAALDSNTGGDRNTATGVLALGSNTTSSNNTAMGFIALLENTGGSNTAFGSGALGSNTTGFGNTAIGDSALGENTTGSFNIAVGFFAGQNLSTGSGNIDIGNLGVDGESNTIRIGGDTGAGSQTATFIAGISGTAVVGDAVVVDANGQLGTVASSARFKKQIRPMDKTSEAILGLKPVSFRYKSDSKGTPQFGLIAEEVAKVNPDLVVRDRNGEIYSVRYEAVNAMLLNEFLKEHKKTEKLEATVASLIAIVKEQAAQIQKVSAQLEASKPASQVVNNNQ
jgi:hypothetical protein